jgi:hypothetical protein
VRKPHTTSSFYRLTYLYQSKAPRSASSGGLLNKLLRMRYANAMRTKPVWRITTPSAMITSGRLALGHRLFGIVHADCHCVLFTAFAHASTSRLFIETLFLPIGLRKLYPTSTVGSDVFVLILTEGATLLCAFALGKSGEWASSREARGHPFLKRTTQK